jgi:hypothetical protein
LAAPLYDGLVRRDRKVDEAVIVIEGHEDDRRVCRVGVKQPEVLPQRGELGVLVAVSDPNVLSCLDVGLIADELEPEIVGQLPVNDVDSLPTLTRDGRVCQSTEPRDSAGGALGQGLAREEQRKLRILLVV